jgi:hypothetical protein
MGPPQRPTTLSLFIERLSIPIAPYLHFSKSLVDEHSSTFPKGAPMETDARLQRLFDLYFRVPSKGVLSPGSLYS